MLDSIKRDAFDRQIAAMAAKNQPGTDAAPPAANGEPGPDANGTPRVAANQGFKSLTIMLGAEPYEEVIRALNQAKDDFGLETQAQALHRLCTDWMTATDEDDTEHGS
jgi:hypothetical protein